MRPSQWLWFACLSALVLGACDGSVDGVMRDAARDADDDDATTVIDSGADLDAGGEDSAVPPPPVSNVCSEDGWCWQLPSPQGEQLNALWAIDADKVWAVGERGVILRFDGRSWSRMRSGIDTALFAVFGFGERDIWAAGADGVVLHFDGAQWTRIETEPQTDGGTMTPPQDLYAIWGTRDHEVWFAGNRGRLYSYSDGAFALISDLPTSNLRGLWGSAHDDVWAVGAAGCVLHFDGVAWVDSTSTAPTNANLFAITGIAADDVWAVGARSALHWDGTQWSDLSAGLDAAAHAVIALQAFALDPGDAGVIADAGLADAAIDAGIDGAIADAAIVDERVLARAFGDNGSVWSFVDGQWLPVASNLRANFLGAAMLDDDDILAVGERGVIQRWLQGARQTLSSGSNAARLSALVDSHNALWIVGDEVLRRRDQVWSLQAPPTERALYGVWADADALWAVGTAGAVMRFDGARWSDVTPRAAGRGWLRSIHGAGSSLWIVGNDGLTLAKTASTWAVVQTATSVALRDVWGFSDDDFWAVGDGATTLHWNGSDWVPVDTGLTSASLRAVWGTASDDVWAVGSLGSVLHWNGSAWSTEMSGGAYTLDDITGRDGKLWTVGNNGTVLHFDGDSWHVERSGTVTNLHTITIDRDGVLWAAGDQGVVLSKQP